MRARNVAGNPTAAAIRHRDLAIERTCDLQGYKRAPAFYPAHKAS
jgi:hypothetical protein